MSFPDDLLEQAYDLANKDPNNPKQAGLRRAVSTAYYALFHLLINEAVNKWSIERHRNVLARVFDHGRMRTVSNDIVNRAKNTQIEPDLLVVAQSFLELQQNRHIADYNNSKIWSRLEVMNSLTLATDAFAAWRVVRTQEAAEDYLLQLLLPRQARV